MITELFSRDSQGAFEFNQTSDQILWEATLTSIGQLFCFRVLKAINYTLWLEPCNKKYVEAKKTGGKDTKILSYIREMQL